MLTEKKENRIIRGGVIIFWLLFWLLNSVDKVIGKETALFVGKDRLAQFVNYFESIGVTGLAVPQGTLIFVSVLEFIALVYLVLALVYYFKGDKKKTRNMFFFGILFSLIVFSFFAIGDQIFGDRVELLEHSTYWISLVISWFVYTHSDKK